MIDLILKLKFLIEKIEVWFDFNKEEEIILMNNLKQENNLIIIKDGKEFLKIKLEKEYLYNQVDVIKIVFRMKPKLGSDTKKWIKINGTIGCPFCNRIPFEIV